MTDLLRIMKQCREQWKLDHKWKHLPVSTKRKLLKGVRECKDPACPYNQNSLPNQE